MIDFNALGERLAGDHSCAQCGQPFKARRQWARFCSATCRTAYHAAHDGVRGMVESISADGCTLILRFERRHRLLALRLKEGSPVKVFR